jgi:hypothetical protein
MKRAAASIMTSPVKPCAMLLLGGLVLWALTSPALADRVAREQDIVNLRLGQRIKVDDGTCPPGQIKEVSGTKMISTGIVRSSRCVQRLGPKTK